MSIAKILVNLFHFMIIKQLIILQLKGYQSSPYPSLFMPQHLEENPQIHRIATPLVKKEEKKWLGDESLKAEELRYRKSYDRFLVITGGVCKMFTSDSSQMDYISYSQLWLTSLRQVVQNHFQASSRNFDSINLKHRYTLESPQMPLEPLT